MDHFRQENAHLNPLVTLRIKDRFMAISTSCARYALLAVLLSPAAASAQEQPGESELVDVSGPGDTTFAVRLFGGKYLK